MKILLLIVLAAAVSYAGYEYARFRSLLIITDSLVEVAKSFERAAGAETMLVLGDSTAVGVGAESPEDTLAGRIAVLHPGWSVENHAVSGARIHDIKEQLDAARKEHYALILIQVGANDIIRFRGAADAAAELGKYLEGAAALSEKTVFLTAGNVGATKFFPSLLNPYYHRATLRYHDAFEKLATRTGTTYVNLYVPPADDPFTKDPERFFSDDGLHLSSEGYRLWFEKVREAL